MMRRHEIYGGSAEHRYAVASEIYEMPAGSDVRIWTLSSEDIASPGFTLRLPDPRTMRKSPGVSHVPGVGVRGGIVFVLCNLTIAQCPITVTTFTQTVIDDIPANQAMILFLLEPTFNGGLWHYMIKPCPISIVGVTTRTVSFGTNISPNYNETRSYSYELESWTSEPNIPLLSGDPRAATAADHIGVSPFEDTVTYLTFNGALVEWTSSQTYVSAQAPTINCTFCGLVDSSGGQGIPSTLDDFMHIANADIGGTPRFTEKYDIGGDSWSAGPTTPSALTAPGETVMIDKGFDQLGPYLYYSSTTPEAATAWIGITLLLNAFVVLKTPPWPWGHAAPCAVGLGGLVNLQNGNYTSGAAPALSSSTNHEYDYLTDLWKLTTPSPVIARGMGCRGTRLYRDRYTFGMGADATAPGTPFEKHWEFNTVTKSYKAKPAAAWGDCDRREGAWARTDYS